MNVAAASKFSGADAVRPTRHLAATVFHKTTPLRIETAVEMVIP